jgi:HK97 family phage prohead protease
MDKKDIQVTEDGRVKPPLESNEDAEGAYHKTTDDLARNQRNLALSRKTSEPVFSSDEELQLLKDGEGGAPGGEGQGPATVASTGFTPTFGGKKKKEEKKFGCHAGWGDCNGCGKEVCKSGHFYEFNHLDIIKSMDGIYIAGYASPYVVDDEGHRIEKPALRTALESFMKEPKFRNVMIVHTGIQVGEVITSVRDSDGKLWSTKVDAGGLFAVCKLRQDIQVGREVIEAIRKGDLNSFSIRGRGLEREFKTQDGRAFWAITKLELYEITICKRGVNPEAKFVLLKSKDVSPVEFQADPSTSIEEVQKSIQESLGRTLQVSPSKITGSKVALRDLIQALDKPVMLSKGFITIAGGIAIWGETQSDIDIVVMKDRVDEPFDMLYKYRIHKALPRELWSRMSWVPAPQGTPHTDFVGLYDLWLVPSKDRETVIRMSKEDYIPESEKMEIIKAILKASGETDSVDSKYLSDIVEKHHKRQVI